VQPIRFVDRALASRGGSRQPPSDRSSRKNVGDLRAYYWSGPGWEAALKEARALVEGGSSVKQAAAAVGWNEKDLVEALKGDGQPVPDQVANPVVKKRPPRPLKNRVKGLGPMPRKTLARAKQLYAVQVMTVREVAEVIGFPYEKMYLALLRAGTKFRRPGRRSGL
jgi:hypothetical protein